MVQIQNRKQFFSETLNHLSDAYHVIIDDDKLDEFRFDIPDVEKVLNVYIAYLERMIGKE